MRDIRFRYRIECEVTTENSVENKILPYYLSIRDIEQRKFLKQFKIVKGNVRIRQIISRDEYTSFLDVEGNELYESDKVCKDNEQLGIILMRQGKWIVDFEESENYAACVIDVGSVAFCIKKVGTIYGDDEQGSVKRYFEEGFKKIDEV